MTSISAASAAHRELAIRVVLKRIPCSLKYFIVLLFINSMSYSPLERVTNQVAHSPLFWGVIVHEVISKKYFSGLAAILMGQLLSNLGWLVLRSAVPIFHF